MSLFYCASRSPVSWVAVGFQKVSDFVSDNSQLPESRSNFKQIKVTDKKRDRAIGMKFEFRQF